MPTYYVDATNGADGNSGLSQLLPWRYSPGMPSYSGGVTPQPDDKILLKCGEVWRATLTVPNSGTNGHAITFGSYGSGALPILKGSEFVTGFANGGANIWDKAAFTTEPKIVFINGVMGTKAANRAGCNGAGKWYWTANTLSVYATSDPSGIVEAGQRDVGFLCKKGYITLQDVHVTHTNGGNAITFSNMWTDATVISNPQAIRVQSDYNYGTGISFTALGTNVTNLVVQDSAFNYNGDAGIFVGNWDADVTGVTIQDNTVIGNVWQATTPFALTHAGISVTSTGEGVGQAHEFHLTNAVIQRNIVTGTANTPGIWCDTVGTGVVVRYNKTYSNYDGIMVEDSSGVQVYYNLSYSNTRIGIQVSRLVHNCLVYNNTIYGCATGISVGWTNPSAGGVTANVCKNNVSVGNSTAQFDANNGGQNDGTNGSGNIYLNNCFGAPSAGKFVKWGGVNKDSVAAFNTAYGSSTSTVGADPLLVSASDFHLKIGSPCIEAGVDVSLTKDFEGSPILGNPDIGCFEYQPKRTGSASAGHPRKGAILVI